MAVGDRVGDTYEIEGGRRVFAVIQLGEDGEPVTASTTTGATPSTVEVLGSGLTLESTDIDLTVASTITDTGDGVDVSGATNARIELSLRANPLRREAFITIETLDLTATYSFQTDDGATSPALLTAATYDADADAPADAAALLAGWADAINAATGYSDRIVAAAVDTDADSVVDALRIRGVDDSDVAIVASGDGTAALTIEADACSLVGSFIGRPDATGGSARRRGWKVLGSTSGPYYQGTMSNNVSATVDVRGLAAVSVIGTLAGHDLDADDVSLVAEAHVHAFRAPEA